MSHFFWDRRGSQIKCACGRWYPDFDAYARHLVGEGVMTAYEAGLDLAKREGKNG